MERRENMQWTAKQIIIGKPLMFGAVTILLFCLLNMVCAILVQPILDMIFPDDIFVAAVRVVVCLCLTVALWMSARILVPVCNKKLNAMEPEAAAVWFARESKFRWLKGYTVALGLLVFAAVSNIWMWYVLKAMEGNDDMNWVKCYVASAVVYVLVLVALYRGAKWLNRYMMRITGTNSELIAEVRNGLHNDKIPVNKRQGAELEGIISVLQEGETHNVRLAVVLYELHVLNRKVCRMALKIGGIGVILGIALANMAGDRLDAEIEDMRQCRKIMREHDEEQAAIARAEYEAKEAIRKHKWREAEQAKKKAYYTRYQANKATAYNAGSYDAYRKRNFARTAYWDWQKADREKYR